MVRDTTMVLTREEETTSANRPEILPLCKGGSFIAGEGRNLRLFVIEYGLTFVRNVWL
ncbi:MAG: hypothetical protein AB3N20_15245 [Rhizobiaceae bacterium]